MDVRPAGWDDFDAVCELLSRAAVRRYGISDVRPESEREWELPSFAVGRDNWVAVEGGRVSATRPSARAP